MSLYLAYKYDVAIVSYSREMPRHCLPGGRQWRGGIDTVDAGSFILGAALLATAAQLSGRR